MAVYQETAEGLWRPFAGVRGGFLPVGTGLQVAPRQGDAAYADPQGAGRDGRERLVAA